MKNVIKCPDGYEVHHRAFWKRGTSVVYLDPKQIPPREKGEDVETGPVIMARSGATQLEKPSTKLLRNAIKQLSASHSPEEMLEMVENFGLLLPPTAQLELHGTVFTDKPISGLAIRTVQSEVQSYLRAYWLHKRLQQGADRVLDYVETKSDKQFLVYPSEFQIVEFPIERQIDDLVLVEEEVWKMLIRQVNEGLAQSLKADFLEWDSSRKCPAIMQQAEHFLPNLWLEMSKKILNATPMKCPDCGRIVWARRKTKQRCDSCRQKKYDRNNRKPRKATK